MEHCTNVMVGTDSWVSDGHLGDELLCAAKFRLMMLIEKETSRHQELAASGADLSNTNSFIKQDLHCSFHQDRQLWHEDFFGA
jgi:hypothetical protein